jgi:hypothetical protein
MYVVARYDALEPLVGVGSARALPAQESDVASPKGGLQSSETAAARCGALRRARRVEVGPQALEQVPWQSIGTSEKEWPVFLPRVGRHASMRQGPTHPGLAGIADPDRVDAPTLLRLRSNANE